MKKGTLLIVAFLTIVACKKNNNVPVDANLKSDFAFKQGSYWIYKDSVTGATDSAYVAVNTDKYYRGGGCVLNKNASEYESIDVYIKVDNGNTIDSESWNLLLNENKCSYAFMGDFKSKHLEMNVPLFSYPLKTGEVDPASGCIVTADSGSVSDILPGMSVNGQNYTNTAQCPHSWRGAQQLNYHDCFYVSPKTGFVKLVFNHPEDSMYRVLELVRYNIVK